MKFRLLITVLILNFIFIIPVNAELFSPFETKEDGVAFTYVDDDFPTHATMNTGESRAFFVRVSRLNAEVNALYTARWFRNNIAVSGEFPVNIPVDGFIDVNLDIINASLFQSGLYTLRITTIYDATISHIDTSRSMNLLVRPFVQEPTLPPPTVVPEPLPMATRSIHVGSQWGAPVSNILSFPVSTKGIPDGFYRISLSGLPLDAIVPTHARVHNGIFNPQLHIRNIWTVAPGNYLANLTVYDETDNIVAESNSFVIMIFDPWR